MTTSQIIQLIDEFDLSSRSRKREKVYMRFYIYSLLKKKNMTLQQIGSLMGVDHSTVIYGINKHEEWMKSKDWIYLANIAELFERINQFKVESIKEDQIFFQVIDKEADMITLEIKMHTSDHEGLEKISGLISRELFKEAI